MFVGGRLGKTSTFIMRHVHVVLSLTGLRSLKREIGSNANTAGRLKRSSLTLECKRL